MFGRRTFGWLWVISFVASTAVTAKSKYYDGDIRPYEFGYRIEGNQHRHEKKDANGIINGEFGFITGDGAYHQSVYATDENGNFKLVSLKSGFRVVKPTTTTVPPTTTTPPTPISQPPKLGKLLQSCSNCKVFEKEVHDKSKPNNFVNQNDGKSIAKKLPTQAVTSMEHLPKLKVKSNSGAIGTISPMNIAIGISAAGIKASEQIRSKQKELKSVNNVANINGPTSTKASQQIKIKSKEEIDNTKSVNGIPTHQISKPVKSVAERTIPVSLQTKSHISVPVSTGITINTKPVESSKTHLSSKTAIDNFIGDVLYRFNYTAGYHGHNEEGDSAGNKRGGYFIIGRDNIRRGVIYVANANGFIPVVKYEKVNPAEAPHEDTEKSAGLRGYEFEWFHKGKSRTDNESGR